MFQDNETNNSTSTLEKVTQLIKENNFGKNEQSDENKAKQNKESCSTVTIEFMAKNQEQSLQQHFQTIQNLLTEELTKKEMTIDLKNKILSSMEDNLKEVIRNKLIIAKGLDFLNNKENNISYVYCEDPKQIYKQELMYITKFINFLWKYPYFIYKIAIHCKTEQDKETMSNFIANYLYTNILSLKSIENNYLFLIYLILRHEINKINDVNNSRQFLKGTIGAYLLNFLTGNSDVLTYLRQILSVLFENIDNRVNSHPLEFELSSVNKILNQKKQQNDFQKQKTKKISTLNPKEQSESQFFSVDDINTIISPILIEKDIKYTINSNEFFNFLLDISEANLKLLQKHNQNNIQFQQYLEKQLSTLEIKQNKNLFKYISFVTNITFSLELEEIIKMYCKNFSIVIIIIDRLFKTLNDNILIIPESLKYIGKIISILAKKQFNDITDIEVNAFVSEFFFGIIILPALVKPKYYNLLLSKVVNQTTLSNFHLIKFIILQLLSGCFFESKPNEHYMIFNRYFMQIMPNVIQFFQKFLDVKLPSCLQDIVDQNDIHLNKNFVNEYANEEVQDSLQYTSICFSFQHLLTIYKIINEKRKTFLECVVSPNIQSDYGIFKRAFDKLTTYNYITNIQNLKNLEDQMSPHTVKFIAFNELIICAKHKQILNLKQEIFSLKEISSPKTDEEITKNTIIKVKNRLIFLICQCLSKLDLDFSKFSGMSFEDCLEYLLHFLSTIKDSSKEEIILFRTYVLNLKFLLLKIPDEYKQNNYEKIFTELENEIKHSIDLIDIRLFAQLENKSKKVKQKLNQTIKQIEDIQKMKYNFSIQEFLEKSSVLVNLEFIPNKKQFNVLKKVEHKKYSHEIRTLKQFIKYFPNFSEISTDENVWEKQKEFKVPEAFDNYYTYLKEEIKVYLLQKETTKDNPLQRSKSKQLQIELPKNLEEEIENILKTLKDYIMAMIYYKIFPSKGDVNDEILYKKCKMLSWIQLKHLGNTSQLDSNQLLLIINPLMKQLNVKKIPNEKMEILSMIVSAIINMLKLCESKIEGTIDDMLPILVFAIIKSQPRFLSSNIMFLKLYHQKELGFGQLSQRLDLFFIATERIINFSYENIMNITEQEYIYNCENNQ